jgi:hypothetical protein
MACAVQLAEVISESCLWGEPPVVVGLLAAALGGAIAYLPRLVHMSRVVCMLRPCSVMAAQQQTAEQQCQEQDLADCQLWREVQH